MGRVPIHVSGGQRGPEAATAAFPKRIRGWWKAVAVTVGTVLASTVAMAVPAVPAQAAKRSAAVEPLVTVVHESSETNADEWKAVDLRCGGHFVGGGGYVTGPDSQNVGLSQVAPGSTGWAELDQHYAMRVSASAAPEAAPADWTLHAYGICAQRLSGVEYESEYVSAASEGKGPLSAVAHCSPGKNLVGVGAQSFAIPGQVRLSTLFPRSDDAAVARVDPQPDPTASWAVQAIAVCADNEVERVLDSTGFDNQDVMHATAECPSGQHPTGAGFLHAGEPGDVMQSLLIPMSDRVVGSTRTDTRTAIGDWLAGSYALCLDANTY